MNRNENANNQQHLPRVNWKFPESTRYGRVIPKDKFYSKASVKVDVKKRFVEQVSQVKWAYKIAESTINLTKTNRVQELEIIQIKLKGQSLDEAVLHAIDSAIPHQTLFLLLRDVKQPHAQSCEEICYQAAHKVKTTTQTKQEKWQQSDYLKSQWVPVSGKYDFGTDKEGDARILSKEPKPLPTATNLEGLYEQLIEALMPTGLAGVNQVKEPEREFVQPLSHENSQATLTVSKQKNRLSIEQKLANLAAIDALNKQILQIKAKRDKEKQFNRKRELNDRLKALKTQLVALTHDNELNR